MMKRIKSMASRPTVQCTSDMTSRARGLRAALLTGTAILTVGLVAPAIGQTSWTGGTDTDWTNPANWDAGVPDSITNTTIDTADPSGAGAVLSTAGAETDDITVGNAGTGLLTINGVGTLVTDGQGYIGRTTGANGTVVVTGTDAQWDINGTLFLTTQFSSSAGAEGTLTIDNEGTVNTAFSAWIGGRGVGTLNVSNLAAFNVGASLFLGDQNGAVGTAQIESGGTIDVTASMTIGGTAGAQGTLTVTGPGSSLTADYFSVGGSGHGALTISNGGAVTTSDDSRVGGTIGGQGSAHVTGTGSRWDISGNFIVGEAGTGEATFADNATGDVQGEVFVGRYSGSQGTLNIESGAVLESGVASIGLEANTVGAVNISGAGSLWDVQGAGNPHLVIGDSGTGTLNVADGGTADVGGETIIGNQDGAEGYLIVSASGADTTLYYSSNNVFFGAEAGSYGEGTISGANAELDASNNLYLGDAGHGVLTVSNGAELEVSSTAYIGHQAGSTGELIIDGGEVDVFGGDPDDEIYVGYEGNGTVTVSNAGLLRARMLHVGAEGGSDGTVMIQSGGEAEIRDELRIGFESGSVGSVTATGAGTEIWGNDYDIRVGVDGTGTLYVTDQALVRNVDSLNIGGLGIVNVDDASLQVTDRIEVGNAVAGVGLLRILNGGTVTSAEGVIGAFSDDTGEVEIDGVGSNWTISDDLKLGLGEGAQGTLSIANGGVAEVGGEILVGGNNSGGIGAPVGTVNIVDGGRLSSTSAGAMSVGFFDGATGIVTVTGGGSEIDLGSNPLRIGHGGTGTLLVNGGGAVRSHNGYIGNLASGDGDVTVTGNGSSWQMTNPLSVGHSGSGELTIADGGVVSSTSASLGYNTGSQGSVLVTGAGSALSINGTIFVGRDGSGELTIADGGSVNAGVGEGIALANAAGETGTLNIGGTISGTSSAAGNLSADLGVFFGHGTATLVFNHTDGNYTFDTALTSTGTGTHEIRHVAGATNYTGDGSGFTGSTTISGGTLFVNNDLGGTVDVDSGVLGGAGTLLGPLTVNSGVVAPGNSIGTLNVASVTFNPGSTYEVEINGTSSTPVAGINNDLIDVTGVANLDGTVNVLPYPGFLLNTPYTILTATTINGAFAGAVFGEDSIFITPFLSQVGSDIHLTLTQTTDFADVAGTPNQAASAAGAQSAGPGSPIVLALSLLNNENDARNAFDQLSGEAHASGKTALINNSARLRTIIGNRIDAVFSNQRPTAAFMSFASKGSPADQLVADRYGAWGHVHGSWGRTASTTNTAAMRHDDAGFMLGADSRFGEAWYGGVFSGYSRSNFKVSGRGSSGSSDNYHLGLYGGGEFGAFHLNMGAAHTWHRIGTTRDVTLPVRERLSASYNARTMQIFGEASYRMEAGAARFEPFAALAHVSLRTDGFTETGGTAALTSFGRSTATTFSTLGLRASTQFQMGDMTATARGMIGWRHAFGDTTPASRLAFAGGNSFLVSGAPIAKNAAVMEFGLDVQVGTRATLGLSYDGQLASGSNEHGARARLRVSF